MYDGSYAAMILSRSQEAIYAARAPQYIARRELELLQAAARTPRQPRNVFRGILARVSARLAGGTAEPVVTGQ